VCVCVCVCVCVFEVAVCVCVWGGSVCEVAVKNYIKIQDAFHLLQNEG
jgi:hypothetical protein